MNPYKFASSRASEIDTQAVLSSAVRLTGGPHDYDGLMDMIGDACFVLLGESTHGTHEFYEERARITRRLIVEKGFTGVAVEADWPDAWHVNRYIRAANDRHPARDKERRNSDSGAQDGRAGHDGHVRHAASNGNSQHQQDNQADRQVRQRASIGAEDHFPGETSPQPGLQSARMALGGFARFPTWMWRNADVVHFIDWLRAHNHRCDTGGQVGFFGLDLYSLFSSIDAVQAYLDRIDSVAAAKARQLYSCFAPFHQSSELYARACRDHAGAGLSGQAAVRDVWQLLIDPPDAHTGHDDGHDATDVPDTPAATDAPAAADAPDTPAAADAPDTGGPDNVRSVATPSISLESLVPRGNQAGASAQTNSQATTRRDDDRFNAIQNARVAMSAEHYYRTMLDGRTASWNIRDSHMADSLDAIAAHLSAQQQTPAKIVVWEHNSHIGDARATESAQRGEHTLGQLVRERYGGACFSVGLTTYEGHVTAASRWNGRAERKRVLPALRGSYELLFHESGMARFLLPLGPHSTAAHALQSRQLLERAIGVLYKPLTERQSHYFFADLPRQFDAVIHIDCTHAVHPLAGGSRRHEPDAPATFPAGV